MSNTLKKKRDVLWQRFKSYCCTPSLMRQGISRLITYLILFDLAYVFLYPFLYMLVTSLKTNADLYDSTVNWIPHTIKWANFTLALKAIPFKTGLINSVITTSLCTLGHLISCSLVGYGLARYKFKGQKLLFFIVLLSIIVPTQAIIVPLYLTYSNLGWINSFIPLILPTFFGFGLRGGLFIFIFRQFFFGLPKELEDAAKIDGCGFLKTFYRIVFPCSKAAFLVTGVLSMVWHWNDFYEPELFAARPNLKTLTNSLQSLVPYLESPSKLQQLIASMHLTDMEAVINNAVFMAGTLMAIIPVLFFFMFLQRQFMQGIERTGLVE